MTDPCMHADSEHHIVNVCEEFIHYPSEDYPCACHGFAPAGDPNVCAECEHPKSRHATVRLCRPASGEFCPCRTSATG